MAWLEVDDGRRIRWEENGEGDPLLLIHPTGMSVEWWGSAAALLTRDHRVVAFDRRGFGQTAGKPCRDAQRHARDAVALIEQVVGGPAAVVGVSSGGTVALELALLRPDLVTSLVLGEPAVHAVRMATPEMLGAIARAKALQLRGRHDEAAEHFERWASGFETGGNSYDRQPEELRAITRADARSVLADLDLAPRSVSGEHLSLEAVRGLPMPITLLLGDLSAPWFHRMAHHLALAVPQMRMRVIPGASHYLARDNPEGFAEAVRWGAAARPPAGRRTPSPA